METLFQDLKFALRTLLKNPGFTLVASLALALGIGANTAIFSVINAVLLRPLPFKEPGQLVRIMKEKVAGSDLPVLGGGEFIGGHEFLAWKEQAGTLAKIAAFGGGNFNLTGTGDAERVVCGQVTGEFFSLLGVEPFLGRSFSADEDRPNAPRVALLGHGIWKRRFGSDPAVVGKTMSLNGNSHTIVGVLPSSFQFTEPFEIWLPMALDQSAEAGAIRISLLKVLARLKPDVAMESARSELETILQRMQPMGARRSAPPAIAPIDPSKGTPPTLLRAPAEIASDTPVQTPSGGPGRERIMRPFPGPAPGAPPGVAPAPNGADIFAPGGDMLATSPGDRSQTAPFPSAPPGALDQPSSGAMMMVGGPLMPPPGRIRLVRLHEHVVANARPALLVLLGAVAFVLLIACANTANLLLARAAARQKEIAIRAALGARRSRIVRQLLTESVMLALVGGLAGLLLARWGIDALRAMSVGRLPHVQEIGIDQTVLCFTLVISLLTGLVFGLAPAVQATRMAVSDSLKEGSSGMGGGLPRHHLRNALVSAEVALAMVLLICAGLLIRSFVELRGVEPGFQAERVLTLQLQLAGSKRSPAALNAFYGELLGRLQSLPGVQHVGITDHLPLTDYSMMASVQVEGKPAPGLFGKEPPVSVAHVSSGYFRAMGIPLRTGRSLTDADIAGGPPVVVVNQAFARRYFGSEDPVGKRLRGPGSEDWQTIVGVVGDVRENGLEREATAEIYRSYLQGGTEIISVAVRSVGDPKTLLAAVRSEVAALDNDLPIYNLMTMEDRLASTIAPRRTNMTLLGAFAGVALALAAVGIYGVMSYSVSQRTREIGVRMSLGADRRDVLKLVVRQGMGPVVAGIVVGLAAAFAVTRLMATLLFGIETIDLATFAVVPLLLAAVAFIACLIPARRAMEVDPIVALRSE